MRIRRKRTGRIAGLLLSLVLVLFPGQPVSAAAGPITAISSPEELIAFGESVDSGQTYAGRTVILTANIDMTGRTLTAIGWRDGADYSHVFQGTFDGGGHRITNLTVIPDPRASGTSAGAGFFADLLNATVRDLTLNITLAAGGQCAAGGLVGRMENGTLENIIVSGTVTSDTWGTPEDGCLAVGMVVGKAVGRTVMDRCAAQGALGAAGSFAGTVYAGGLAGYMSGSSITNSYSTACVFINDSGIYVGGFTGGLEAARLENCYAASLVMGGGTTVGAFAGYWNGGSAANVWYDTDMAASLPDIATGKNVPALQGASTARMQDSAFPGILGDAFVQAGSPVENNGYPVFPSGGEPEPTPTEEPAPTTEPSPAPTEEPIPTADPSPIPTIEPEITTDPGPTPTEEPPVTSEPFPPATEAPALPVDPTQAPTSSPEPTSQPEVPATGDESAIFPWMVILCACGAGLVFITRKLAHL